jgi:hypothetical protein
MDQVLADYGKLGISFDKIHCSQQQQTAKLINYETRMAKIEQRQQQQVTTTLDLEQTAKELHAKMDACLATLFA